LKSKVMEEQQEGLRQLDLLASTSLSRHLSSSTFAYLAAAYTRSQLYVIFPDSTAKSPSSFPPVPFDCHFHLSTPPQLQQHTMVTAELDQSFLEIGRHCSEESCRVSSFPFHPCPHSTRRSWLTNPLHLSHSICSNLTVSQL